MTIVAVTSGFSASSDNAPIVTKPAGVGDAYVLTIVTDGTYTVTWPSGFTEIPEHGAEVTLNGGIRTAILAYTGTEGATFVSSTSGFSPWAARCALISGVSATLADSDSTGNYTGFGNTSALTGNNVATGATNRYIFWIGAALKVGATNLTSLTPPTSFTEYSTTYAPFAGTFVSFCTYTDPTNHTVSFSGSAGYGDSDTRNGLTATLVFAQLPIIDTQPAGQTIYQGQGASFTVAATTTGGSLSYQWKDDGSNVGTDSTTYAPTPALSDSGSLIRCDVTDSNGTRSTNNALLTVLPAAITAWIRA